MDRSDSPRQRLEALFTAHHAELLAFVLGGETTLVAGGMTAGHLTSNGGPGMEVGGRYLVSGDEDYLWNCGFTQTYSEALAAEWEATAR